MESNWIEFKKLKIELKQFDLKLLVVVGMSEVNRIVTDCS